MYLLDSDYIIYFLKGRKEAVELVSKLPKNKIFTSIICVGEVLEGLYYAKNKKFIKLFERFLKTIKIIDVNRAVIDKFAKLRGKLRQKGRLLDNFDLLIASTCLEYNLTLVSGNKSHFSRIPKLKIHL